ncbi:DUF2284 domain-containing protein [Chloroflexota bacterium]
MEEYVKLAKKLGITDARLITPDDIVFDIRAYLKCRWGCSLAPTGGSFNMRCNDGGTTFEERQAMIRAYKHILLLHSDDKVLVSCVALDVESAAFLDGHYFAFALRACNLCINCAVQKGKQCPTPKLIRPCEQLFSIDDFATVRRLGFPIDVIQEEGDEENRYAFVLIN